MAGYGETYLQGLQHLSGMVHARRQEEIAAHNEKLREANLQRQYQLMSNQEKARAIQFQIQQQNQHRLQQQGDEAQKARLTSLELRLKQMLQPHYGQPQDMVGPDFKTRQVVRDAKSGQLFDAQSLQPISPQEGATLRTPKPLPVAERKALQGAGDNLGAYTALLKSFKPEYAGYVVPGAGELIMGAKSVIPGLSSEGANWWREYHKLAKQPERHGIAGSALTPREIVEFEKGDVGPELKPEDIVGVLNRRVALKHRGLARAMNSTATRYNPKEVEDIAGMAIPPLDKTAPEDLNAMTRYGARISGVGRPPLEDLLKDEQ